jgi:hypothetical protein
MLGKFSILSRMIKKLGMVMVLGTQSAYLFGLAFCLACVNI